MKRKETIRLGLLALLLVLMLGVCTILATQICAAEAESTEATEEAEVSEEDGGDLAAWIQEHSTDIISVCTLIGSLAVAFLYKTGLLPAISRFIKSSSETSGSLQQSVDLFQKDTQEKLQKCFEALSGVSMNAEGMNRAVEAMGDIVDTLKSGVEAVRNDQAQQAEIMKHLCNMLYKVVMSSSAPEYIRSDVAKEYGEVVSLTQPPTGEEGEIR